MQLDQTREPLRRVAKGALALEAVLGIGALAGGLILMLAPRGEILPLPLSALAGSPFDTYFVPRRSRRGLARPAAHRPARPSCRAGPGG